MIMVEHSWYRRWNGTVTDPKWRTIARLSGQDLCRVLAVWDFLLEDANANATERGRTKSNAEDIASAFDLEIGDVEAIISHMQGRVLDGDLIINWSKRQPAREDDSASRAKKWREEQKVKSTHPNSATPPNAPERKRTQTNADRTHPNANERSEKSREEKRREEEDPPIPPQGGSVDEEPPALPILSDGLPPLPGKLARSITEAYERILVPCGWARFGGWYDKLTRQIRICIGENPARGSPGYWEEHFNRIRGSDFPNTPKFGNKSIVWATNPETVGKIENGMWQGGRPETGSLSGSWAFLCSLNRDETAEDAPEVIGDRRNIQ